jgi:hypothetical protein
MSLNVLMQVAGAYSTLCHPSRFIKGMVCVAALSLSGVSLTGCKSLDAGIALGESVQTLFGKPESPSTPGTSSNGKPAATPSTTTAGSAALASQPSLSETSKAELMKLVVAPVSQPDLTRAKTEAAVPIAAVIEYAACRPNKYSSSWDAEGPRLLSRYMAPDADYYLIIPIASMKYHPKGVCVGIYRMENWALAAKNALSFTVHYLSAESGEGIRINYVFVKQPTGEWLARNMGWQ